MIRRTRHTVQTLSVSAGRLSGYRESGWPHLRRAALLVLMLVVLCGCGNRIGTKPIGFESAYRQINQNALQSRTFSQTSLQVLSRYNLNSAYKKDPKTTLGRLQERTRTDNRRDLLFALAELNYQAAGRPSQKNQAGFQKDTKRYYLNAAVFAYFYLFEPGMDGPADVYDRNFRWACDIFNVGLARALMNEDGRLELTIGKVLLPEGSIRLSLDAGQFPWNPHSGKGNVTPADNLEVYGLSLRNREAGLGVPFLVVLEQEALNLPVKRSYPGTLLLTLKGNLKAYHDNNLQGTLTLYTPFKESSVRIGGTEVPLEKDMSAQLAHTLNQGVLWNFGLREFFTGKNRFKTGLYEIIPYSHDRIPVVFVHGTFSSPVAWAEMCNTLLADPVIRKRFVFWLYLYDSNRPVNLSALYLRGALRAKLNELDPENMSSSLQQMVVIGHSQGGLLTRLTATDTGDRIIRQIMGKGLDEMPLTEEQRELLERTAVFTPLPFVKRVVFISTPHRGSKLVTGWLTDLVRKAVSLSAETLRITSDVHAAIPEENIPEEWRYKKTVTSIDSMSPENPALLAFSKIPVADGVKSHSIIPVKGEGDPRKGSDGVVDYASAHLEDVDSELIIQPGKHSVQRNPLAIEEVRRILHLHLDEQGATE
jgi:pimeloyl-ACP methyl ester carboxylesterase